MSITENRQVVQTFYDTAGRGDMQGCFNQMADDVSWTNIGTTKYSGTYRGKDDINQRLLGPLFSQLEGGLISTIHTMTAEGDLVAVQLSGQATTKTGRPYNNTYCHVFTVRDGKIRAVTEYLDTQLVSTVFA
jgi:uncharacterized protein